MSEPSESYVLSDGYHDRAFWCGQLLHLGCIDPGARPNGQRREVLDHFGLAVRGGHFAFHSRSKAFIRIVPAGGKANIPAILRTRLKESEIKRVQRLVVNVDADEHADGTPPAGQNLTLQQLEALAREFDDHATTNTDGDIEIYSGETKITLVRWRAPDPAIQGVPHQQSLAPLIFAALAAVHP